MKARQGYCMPLLCLIAIMIAAWMIPSAAADGDTFLVKSKQEGETKCEEIGNQYGNYAVYRDGPEGNDILYSCGYRSEKKTKLNRSNKCNPKTFPIQYIQGTDAYYTCSDNGNLVLEECKPDDSDNDPGVVRGPVADMKCKPIPGYR